MWTIYRRPRDYPHGVIARRWEIGAQAVHGPTPTDDCIVGPSVEMVREEFARRGLVCLPRSERDHPSVVESYI